MKGYWLFGGDNVHESIEKTLNTNHEQGNVTHYYKHEWLLWIFRTI